MNCAGARNRCEHLAAARLLATRAPQKRSRARATLAEVGAELWHYRAAFEARLAERRAEKTRVAAFVRAWVLRGSPKRQIGRRVRSL